VNGTLAGGLGGLLDKLQKGGLGNVVDSWLNSGDNQAVSPDQLRSALGPEVVRTLAQRSGLGLGEDGIGMIPITTPPKWLEYEHRTWFPKKDVRNRIIDNEAHYLWLPPDVAQKFITKMIPVADGRRAIKRLIGDPEEFLVEYDTPAIKILREEYGSIEAAVEAFDYSIFKAPPSCARIGDAFF
jgi:hypothetical protein